jgi:hypothetical protein
MMLSVPSLFHLSVCLSSWLHLFAHCMPVQVVCWLQFQDTIGRCNVAAGTGSGARPDQRLYAHISAVYLH